MSRHVSEAKRKNFLSGRLLADYFRGVDVFVGKSDPLDEGILSRFNLRRVGQHFSYLAMDVGSWLGYVTGFL